MTKHWNWTSFFDTDTQAVFELHQHSQVGLEAQCQELAALSFEQGLGVIVSSIPHFEHEQWCVFQEALADFSTEDKYAHWLHIAQGMMSLLPDVRDMLAHYDVQHAVNLANSHLNTQDDLGKLAFVACLKHYAEQDFKAEMILQYLLRNYDHKAEQIGKVKRFYQTLTARQQDVATLAAYGYTNQEIADELVVSSAVVAEHLTAVFLLFTEKLNIMGDSHGTRYRLIHHLTRLFEQHPDLLIEKASS